ncbi:MAG: VCBS repeat-containing protein [Bacteroidota bacterium]
MVTLLHYLLIIVMPETAKLSANLVGLNLSDKLAVTATYSDGTTRDVTADAKLSPHPNVVQLSIDLADADGDGFADAVIKTKTKSNQSNDKVATGDVTGDGNWSPRSNTKRLSIATGDVNGDGISEMVVGNSFSWGVSNSSSSRSADRNLGASNPAYGSTGRLADGKNSLSGGALPRWRSYICIGSRQPHRWYYCKRRQKTQVVICALHKPMNTESLNLMIGEKEAMPFPPN